MKNSRDKITFSHIVEENPKSLAVIMSKRDKRKVKKITYNGEVIEGGVKWFSEKNV